MTERLLPTTVVGSYPQPDWLVNRALLRTMVPRVRVHELWRVQEPYLAQAQDDATLLAIRDMERAGIDIITDGEMRRESYSNRFATALDGIDNDNPATITNRAGRSVSVPRVVGKVRRKAPVEVIARHGLSRGASVTVVRLGGRALVLGVTEHQVSLLTELDPAELDAPADAIDPGSSSAGTAGPGIGSGSLPWKVALEQLRERTVRRS